MSGTDVLAEEAEAIPPSEEAELSQGDEEVLEDQEGSQRSLLGQSVPDASNFNKTKKTQPAYATRCAHVPCSLIDSGVGAGEQCLTLFKTTRPVRDFAGPMVTGTRASAR